MKKILSLFLLLACFSVRADLITWTVTVTNIPADGATITIAGNVRTWKTIVATPSTQIQIVNSHDAGTNINVASNLFSQTIQTPAGAQPAWPLTSSNVTYFGQSTLAVSVSAGWAKLVSVTTTTTSAEVVATSSNLDFQAFQPAARTNFASGIVAGLTLYATNAFPTNSPPLVNYTPTNGTFYGSVSNGIITNATAISGRLVALTNGYITNTLLYNGTNFGLPFRSPGTVTGSEQFGLNAAASATAATAIGDSTIASGSGSVALGNSTTAAGNGSISILGNADTPDSEISIGEGSEASGQNAIALGADATTDFAFSTALGNGAIATTAHQVMLGTASEYIQLPGNVFHQGIDTNLVTGGTNSFGGVIVNPVYVNASLANGANAGINSGTNVYIKVSGPTGAFTINGIASGQAGEWIEIQNSTGQQLTIANDSGVDPVAANRIFTGSHADITITNNPGYAMFRYDSALTHWVLASLNGIQAVGGSGSFTGSFTGNGSGLTNLTLNYRAATVTVTSLSTSQAVVFSTPFQPGTTYAVTFGFDSTLTGAVVPSSTTKTTNGFTLTLSSAITGSQNIDYEALPIQ